MTPLIVFGLLLGAALLLAIGYKQDSFMPIVIGGVLLVITYRLSSIFHIRFVRHLVFLLAAAIILTMILPKALVLVF